MVDFLCVIPNRVFVYIYFDTTACAHQPCFPGPVCIRCLQYETHAERPDPLYHMMHAAAYVMTILLESMMS